MKRIDKTYKIDNCYEVLVSSVENANKAPTVAYLHTAGHMGRLSGAIQEFGEVLSQDDYDRQVNYIIPTSDSDDVFMPHKLRETLLKIPEGINLENLNMVGSSMGGRGTWDFCCTFPEIVNRIAPVSGFACYLRARKLYNKSVWAFHGSRDGVVPIEEAAKMMRELKQINPTKTKFTIDPKRGHEMAFTAFNEYPILKWVAGDF